MIRALLLLLLLATSAMSQNPDFDTNWVGYDTGSGTNAQWPWAARVGDLDNDGDLDIATVSTWFFKKLSILLNDGQGRYDQPVLYDYVLGALDLELVDVTGDGFLDIVVSNSGANYEGDSISLFRNNGDGSFAPQQEFVVGEGSFPGPVGLAAGDFTGDGLPDVAVAMWGFFGSGSTVKLLENDGLGGFLPARTYPAGIGPYKLVAADLNGDGIDDLAVARDKQFISVLLADGLGGFSPFSSYAGFGVFNGDFYQTIDAGDIDNDGDIDLVYTSTGMAVGGTQGATALYRNNGNGTFHDAEFIDNSGGIDVSIADVDGDGWADLLAARGDLDRWSLNRNDGAGGFLPEEIYYAGDWPIEVTAGDVDGDGDLDPIIVSRGSLEVSVYDNDGSLQPPPFTFLGSGILTAQYGEAMDAGDIDGDGDLDVVVAYRPIVGTVGGVLVVRNQGDGSFTPPVNYSSPSAQAAKLRDLDGDGDLDLIWADDGQSMRTRMNDGDGNFGPAAQWPVFTCKTTGFDAFDVDNDGDIDGVLLEGFPCGLSNGRIYIIKNDGNGNFAFAYTIPSEVIVRDIANGDFNGDGLMDFATTGVTLRVYLGTGGGNFSPYQISGGRGNGIICADLDGDGLLDLATAVPGWSGLVQGMNVYIGRPDGSFKLPVFYEGSFNSSSAGSDQISDADIDGDGDIDILVANYTSHDLSLFRNKGDGSFEPQVRYGAWHNPMDIVAADFTGDGDPDVAVVMHFGPSGGVLSLPFSIGVLEGLSSAWLDLGNGLAGTTGVPTLAGDGVLEAGTPIALVLQNALASAQTTIVVGLSQIAAPFKGGVLVPNPDLLIGQTVDITGAASLGGLWPSGIPSGFSIYFQYWIVDAAGPLGFAASNAVSGTTP